MFLSGLTGRLVGCLVVPGTDGKSSPSVCSEYGMCLKISLLLLSTPEGGGEDREVVAAAYLYPDP